MMILTIGILLWICVHTFPALAPIARQQLKDKLGNMPYQGLFSLSLILALYLIVSGWKAATPTFLYQLPGFFRIIALALMLIATILFITSKAPTRLRQFVRHPQMCAVILWSIAHLLTNGDSRSILLFGNMMLWAIIEVIYINKRDQQWIKPKPSTLPQDVVTVAIGVTVFVVLIFVHPYLSGVPLRG